MASKPKVPGSARGTLSDPAEKWLRDNDPHYASNKRKWSAPTTDALARALSETNRAHSSFDGLTEATPQGNGAYGRKSADDFAERVIDTVQDE
jgi:hypothetical protein